MPLSLRTGLTSMDMSTREAQLRLLYELLGDLPDRERPISCTKIREEQREWYTVETLLLDLNGIEPVPAYFTRPHASSGRLPTILYNHAHGGEYEIGKEELLSGRGGLQKPPYAEAFARAGYAALCIDTWAFGERRGRTESTIFKQMLWYGQVMWGMMVYDSLRAVDYLVSREDVDVARIATLGLSMGSTMAWWLAALDERIKVCVDLLCLSDFHSFLNKPQALDGHGVYYFVPGLLKHFDTASINALAAPRLHLALAGNYDGLTPPEGLDRIDAALRDVYAAANAPQAWQLLRYETGHYETAVMRHAALSFLQRWL
ncbi:MAG TPA: alpha/beta hydrolase family protein [Abditibacteriaceae bacterium]|nr:alpha/beta hydrolase family protein [Abditibacteriaceae bacterium]